MIHGTHPIGIRSLAGKISDRKDPAIKATRFWMVVIGEDFSSVRENQAGNILRVAGKPIGEDLKSKHLSVCRGPSSTP